MGKAMCGSCRRGLGAERPATCPRRAIAKGCRKNTMEKRGIHRIALTNHPDWFMLTNENQHVYIDDRSATKFPRRKVPKRFVGAKGGPESARARRAGGEGTRAWRP